MKEGKRADASIAKRWKNSSSSSKRRQRWLWVNKQIFFYVSTWVIYVQCLYGRRDTAAAAANIKKIKSFIIHLTWLVLMVGGMGERRTGNLWCRWKIERMKECINWVGNVARGERFTWAKETSAFFNKLPTTNSNSLAPARLTVCELEMEFITTSFTLLRCFLLVSPLHSTSSAH